MKKNLSKTIPLIFLIAAVAAFGHEVFWGKVPFFRDLGTYMYPLRYSLAESLRSGHLPLWDRRIAMGFPLLANPQTATFYPPHLIFAVLPFFPAEATLLLFHYLVAAIGSYLLFRRWQYGAAMALTAAILFTFGGIIVSLVNLQDHFQTAVWLPWLILTAERTFTSKSWGPFIAFTLIAAVQFLAGSPEMYGMSMALVIFAALKDRVETPRSWIKSIGLVACANVIVVSIAMAQVLPTLELFFQSRRPAGLVFEEAAAWSLNPRTLLNLFWLDRDVDMNQFTGLKMFFDDSPTFFITYYLGALSLFGICAWLFYSSRKERIVLISAIAASLLLAFGDYTRIYYYLFNYVPFFRIVRFPEKYFFLTYSLLIFAAVSGLNEFLRDNAKRKNGPVILFAAVVAVQLIVYLFSRFGTERLLAILQPVTAETAGKFAATLPGIISSLERQIILCGSLLAALLIYRAGKLRPAVLQGIVVLLVFIDLTSAHRPYQFMLKPDFASSKSKLLPPPGEDHYRLFIGFPYLHPSRYTFKLQPFPGVVAAQWTSLYPNTGVLDGFEYMQEIDTFGRIPYSHFLNYAKNLPPDKMYPFLGALNIKYVTSFNALPAGPITSLGYFAEYPLWLYRVDRTVARVYVARNVVVEDGIDKALKRMTADGFDPLTTVVVDQPPPVTLGAPRQAHAAIRRYENAAVDIDAALDAPGMLVLADSYDPGWRAYVDGKRETVLRANAFFRALALPAGKHRVEFRYEPLSFTIGAAVSLATLFGLLIWTAFVLLARRAKKDIEGCVEPVPLLTPPAATFYAASAPEGDTTLGRAAAGDR